MDEYAFLAGLCAVAVATVVGGIMLRRRLGPKISVKGKAGRKGGNGSNDPYYRNRNEKVPDEKGEVWQDDDLYSLKEGKEKGVYKGDKEEVKDDGEYESWDKY